MTIRELFTARKAYEAAHEDATAIVMEIHRRFHFLLRVLSLVS